jgi:hypothetical protein
MPSSYSSNLKIELMATGENSGTWGTNTNTNLGTAMEQAIIGYGNPDYTSDANLTITISNSSAAQAARALVLNVTSVFGSLTATRELIVPTIQKQYIVQNNTTGGQSITVKTSAGTGITVPTGRKAHLYVDGTNVIQMFDFVDINGGTIDGATVGASSASTGSFTTLNATGAITLNTTTNNQSYTTTSTGIITISSGTAGSINNMTIGATTAGTGRFSSITNTGLTSGRVVYSTTNGLETDSANLTFDGTNLTLLGGTANGVAFLNGSKVLTSGSAIIFDGTNFATTGTATAAKLIPTGSSATGNGLYLPAANSVGISTNGTNAVYIDSTQNVGIGTSSPTQKLTVATGSVKVSKAYSYLWDDANVEIRVDDSPAWLAVANTMTFKTYSGAFVFRDSNAGTSIMTVRADTGNVGIGTSSPKGKLDSTTSDNSKGLIVSGSTNLLRVYPYYNFGGNNRGTMLESTNVAESAFGDISISGNTIQFLQGASTERMRIDSSGNVGIGTSSPAANNRLTLSDSNSSKLTLTGGSTQNGMLFNAVSTANQYYMAGGVNLLNSGDKGFLIYDATNARAKFFVDDGIGETRTLATTFLSYYTGATERMRIDSSGNVGIGTSSPNQKLDVQGVNGNVFVTSTTGTNAVSFRATNTGGYMIVGRDTSTGSNFGSAYASVVWSNGAYPMLFATNDIERMRIDSSGNLLVGTTSAQTGVAADAVGITLYGPTATGVGVFVRSNGYPLYVNNKAANGGLVQFYCNGNDVGSIQSNGTTTSYNTTSDYRLKTVVGAVTGQGARIDALKPVDYQWKADGQTARGFLAHQFQEVYAASVTGTKDAVDADGNPKYQAMQAGTSEVIADLVAEIQSLRKRLTALEST